MGEGDLGGLVEYDKAVDLENEDVDGGKGAKDEEEGEDEGEEGEDDDEYEEELRALQEDRLRPREAPSTSQAAAAEAAQQPKRKRGLETEEALQGPLDLPYTIPVPETYEA